MEMKNSYLTVTDQFCGAGGSSQGARNVSVKNGGGLEVKLALNHWKLAVETHNTNFPDTQHECTDISAVDPRRFPSTNILITSPECTNHSLAKGKKRKWQQQLKLFGKVEIKPEEERSRATMWDMPRFAEFHNYEIIVVENVVDARYWVMWDAWLKAMHLLGYRHKSIYINSMHCHPTPQSRDRMYVIFWKKGNKAPDLEFMPAAFCQACDKEVRAFQWWKNQDKKWGKYREQYLYRCPVCNSVVEPYYYAAFNIIDWSIPGKPVLNRPKPLSENTIRRIEYGLKKFGHEYLTVSIRYTTGISYRVKDLFNDPVQTQVGHTSHSVVLPFIINTDHAKGKDSVAVRSCAEASRTVTTSDNMGIAIPYIVENNGQSLAKSSTSPFPCVTTQPKHGVINPESISAFMSYYNGGSDMASSITSPVGTVVGTDRIALVKHKAPALEDCTYRTIRPHEVQAAMAFDRDYVVLGNSKDKVRQLGNAVNPPVMEWIIERCVESLK